MISNVQPSLYRHEIRVSPARSQSSVDYTCNRRAILYLAGISSVKWISEAKAFESTPLCPLTADYDCSTAEHSGFTKLMTEVYEVEVPSDYRLVPKGPSSEILQTQRFQSEDGSVNLSLVRRLASNIKPSFFQISDISQYGDLQEVGKLVLPKRISPFETISRVLHQDPVDTGTFRGIVDIPDINIYQYKFQTPGDSTVWISAAATRGNVYLIATSTSNDKIKDLESQFQTIHDSFILKRKIEL